MEFDNCCEEQRMNDEDVGTEEELIDLVKACPILYDVRLKVYKDRNMKDSAWRSISEAMKLSGKTVYQIHSSTLSIDLLLAV